MITSKLHYVDIALAPGEDDLLGVLIKRVHHLNFNSAPADRLGLDFPGWTGAETIADVQNVRIFGSETAFAAAEQNLALRRIFLMCGASQPRQVPAQVESFSRVSRANRADRQSKSHWSRLARRAAARGESFDPSAARKNHLKRQEVANVAALSAPLRSTSTGQQFGLKVSKVAVPPSDALDTQGNLSVEFSSYGLCLQGALPQF